MLVGAGGEGDLEVEAEIWGGGVGVIFEDLVAEEEVGVHKAGGGGIALPRRHRLGLDFEASAVSKGKLEVDVKVYTPDGLSALDRPIFLVVAVGGEEGNVGFDPGVARGHIDGGG